MVGSIVVALFIFFIVLPIAIIVIMGLFGISLFGLIAFLKKTAYVYKNKWFWIAIGAIFLMWRFSDDKDFVALLLQVSVGGGLFIWLAVKLLKKYKELLK